MKTVSASREAEGKWTFEFSDNIRQRDINHLKRLLVVEYSRKKFRGRIARKKAERLAVEASTTPVLSKVTPSVKDTKNG